MQHKANDTYFSKLIRQRDAYRCQYCNRNLSETREVADCAHIFGRASLATRWMSQNAICLCRTCHMFFTGKRNSFLHWMRAHSGDEVIDRLQFLHGLTIKLSKADLKDIEADLKAQAKTQQPGEGFDTPATILLAIQEAESSAGRVFVAGLQ